MRNNDFAKQEATLNKSETPIPNISDIEHNEAAQNYLRERSRELNDDDEKLFEEIYQAKLASGAAMIQRRAMRRDAAVQQGKQYESYLENQEQELAYYEAMAKEDTAKAMSWLNKDRKAAKGTGK